MYTGFTCTEHLGSGLFFNKQKPWAIQIEGLGERIRDGTRLRSMECRAHE